MKAAEEKLQPRSPIGIYVINLDSRQDRWEKLAGQLDALGLDYRRVAAVDGTTISDEELARHFPRKGPLGQLGRGDMACTLSHFRAMRVFLESDKRLALVLEDDVVLAQDLPEIVHSFEWWPSRASLIKLETYLTRDLFVLLGPQVGTTPSGRPIRPLLSRHTGAAGYLIDRSAAQVLIDLPTVDVPIDHLLFNPNVSAIARTLSPMQVEPGMVRQRRNEFGSDIGWLRAQVRPTGFRYWWRETIRGMYEIRRLHLQAFEFAFRKARLVKPTYAENYAGRLPASDRERSLT